VAARGAGAATGLPVIGYLSTQSADGDTNRTVPCRRGLKETGYVDGKNVAVECRHAKDIE
jgi:hypothetical protein